MNNAISCASVTTWNRILMRDKHPLRWEMATDGGGKG